MKPQIQKKKKKEKKKKRNGGIVELLIPTFFQKNLWGSCSKLED